MTFEKNNKYLHMNSKKKYKKELLKSLKYMEAAESTSLKVMTNLMLLKELKENNISFKKAMSFLSKTISLITARTKMSVSLQSFVRKR